LDEDTKDQLNELQTKICTCPKEDLLLLCSDFNSHKKGHKRMNSIIGPERIKWWKLQDHKEAVTRKIVLPPISAATSNIT
ncbi:hypothetical protein E2320_009935, partial [Naja naja]